MAPITLHTGVASLEAGEAPLPEGRGPAATADLVNLARAAGRRVIAVGTTCTRALERRPPGAGGAASPPAAAGPAWCSGPEHPARVVTGLITGWHEAGASHLALLAAVAGPALVEASYREAACSRLPVARVRRQLCSAGSAAGSAAGGPAQPAAGWRAASVRCSRAVPRCRSAW